MGYYLPPKSYLRPKPRISFKQKVIAITTATLTLVLTGSIFTSLNLDSKKSNADATVKKQKIDLIIQPPLTNSNPTTSEKEKPINFLFPVQLAYFKAIKDLYSLELKWSTTLEYKNEYFIIEKSINGSNFYEIGRVDSKKSNEKSSDYSLIDNELSEGVVFYRLRQVSFDEKSTYIALEKVIMNDANENLSLYIETIGPQPFEKYFNINYYTDREGGVSVELFDKNGKKIYKSYTNAEEGYNTCKFIDGHKLTDDAYTVRIANSSGAFVKKIKKKV